MSAIGQRGTNAKFVSLCEIQITVFHLAGPCRRMFAPSVNRTKLFHEKHFGTIARSLTQPFAQLTFDPEGMRRIDAEDLQFLAKECKFL
jgi:hypothetical protein